MAVIVLTNGYICKNSKMLTESNQVRRGNPNWEKGIGGNPSGKPKGALTVKGRQWKELHDSITGYHTQKFNETLGNLWHTDPMLAMRMYLEILNYFKPRQASATAGIHGVEGTGIVIQLNPADMPVLPCNIDGTDE